MLRYILYVITAVLAFMIGVGWVSIFSFPPLKPANAPAKIHMPGPSTVAETSPIPNPGGADYIFPPISLEEKAKLLFGTTITKWIKGFPVEDVIRPSPERIERLKQISLFPAEYARLTAVAEKSYGATLIDLNGDSQKEMIIRPTCDKGWNCSLWIVRKTFNGFAVILKTDAYSFEIKKKRSQKYFEIRIDRESERLEGLRGLYIYKYDGGEYYLDQCYEYEYRRQDRNGNWTDVKDPKLIELHCC